MAQNLTSKTLSSLSWSTAATFVQLAAQFVYTPIMARLLEVTDFGLVALAGVFLRLATVLSGMGLEQAVIQKKMLSKEDVRAAFTLMLGLSVIFYIIIYIVAPYIALFFTTDDTERLVQVIRVMAFSFVITGIFSLSRSLLRRDLRFKITAPIQVIATLVGFFGVGITTAFMGWGVWSLVFANLTQLLVTGILNYGVVRHDLRPIFGWTHFKPLFGYGSKNTIVTVLEFFGANLIDILSGKLFGLLAVGYYTQANRIVRIPTFRLNNSLSAVLFPAFSRAQNDKAKLRSAYISAISFTGFFLMPVLFGLSMMAEPVVLLLLGGKWRPSIPLLQLIALAPPITFMSHYGGVMCMALAKLKLKMYVQIVFLITISISMYFLYPMGVIGLVWAFLIAKGFHHIYYFFIVKNLLEFKASTMLLAYTPGLIGGAIVVSAFYVLKIIAAQLLFSPVTTLIAAVIVGGFCLLLSLFLDPNGIVRLEIVDKIEKVAGKKKGGIFGKLYKLSRVLKY